MLKRLFATLALFVGIVAAPLVMTTSPASAALANINNTWTYASTGKCRYSMKQPFTNKVQLRIDDGDCYRVRLIGYVDGSDQWQCRTPTGGGYTTWPAIGSVMTCWVSSTRLGATNANLCFVEAWIYDVAGYFDVSIYVRGGRIV
jgi:hypothetical protein